MLLLFASLACSPVSAPDSGGQTHEVGDEGDGTDGGGTDTGGDGGGEDGGTVPPVDDDGDGYSVEEDCDDHNWSAHPGATEIWNEFDDDCDGRIDGDGEFSASITLSATAIVEGISYPFHLDCPGTLSRTVSSLDFLVSCSPDPEDADAMKLLGESLTLSPRKGEVEAESWSGLTTLTSSNDWDTYADGSLLWSGFDEVAFTATLDTVSLDLTATGTFALQR